MAEKNITDHLWLRSRGGGDCKRLCGRVHITVVLVDDPSGLWDEESEGRLQAEHSRIARGFEAEAAAYGAKLSVDAEYLRCSVDHAVTRDNCGRWKDAALRHMGFPDSAAVIPQLKKKYGSDEAPVLFYMNYKGRAFAVSRKNGGGFECGILYSDDGDFRHELCHLYGAADLYYPERLYGAAKKYFPRSVMINSRTGAVDSLTAYLIGWTDTLSPEARGMLGDTLWLTEDYLREAHEDEVVTGFAVKRYGNRVYTGELVLGVPHGRGRMEWASGDVYEGDWVDGVRHGRGVYTHKSGASYDGEWVRGVKQGFGIYRFADGGVYEGEWQNGDRHGHGIYRYPSGRVYEGRWENDHRAGKPPRADIGTASVDGWGSPTTDTVLVERTST